jgi:nucleoid-associated protein YgaU
MPQYRKTNIQSRSYKGKRYLKPVKYPSIPISSNDIQILTDSGDRLDNLANQFYGDTSYWIWIVLANPDKLRRDSYYVAPGTQLRIPSNISAIVSEFKSLNK